MIKKYKNWWYPETDKKIISEERFTCYFPLDQSFPYVTTFDTAIDVGAWIGDSTEHLSKKFKNVIAFEPSKATYTAAIENLKERNINNVTFYNVALSNEQGTGTLYNTNTSMQGFVSELTEFKKVAPVRSEIITKHTLDSYNFKNINFIKIDVDSYEAWLLQGARQFFMDNNPIICIEHKPRILQDRQPSNMPDSFKILNSYGYKLKKKLSKLDYLWTR